MQRKLHSALALVLIWILAACSGEKPGDQSLREVTFNMSWLPQGSMAGVIVAIDKGFYKERGLLVNTTRGFGGIRTVNELDQGMFEFGYGGPLAVILNRSNGGQARMIGALNQRWPAGLCYITERHQVSTPRDLSGFVVGGGQNSPVQQVVPAWLRANAVSADAVTMMQLSPAVISASLIEGDIDAGECWAGNSLPVYRKRAREAGLTIGLIEYSAHNLDIYGNGLVTTDRLIAQEPELVQAFVDATYQGYAWMKQNTQDAADTMLRHFPTLDPQITLEQVEEMAELIGTVDQLGVLEEKRVGNTLSFLTGAYDVKSELRAGDIYSDRFLRDAGGQ